MVDLRNIRVAKVITSRGIILLKVNLTIFLPIVISRRITKTITKTNRGKTERKNKTYNKDSYITNNLIKG